MAERDRLPIDVVDVIGRSGWTDREIGDLQLRLNAVISDDIEVFSGLRAPFPPRPPDQEGVT